MQKPENMYPDIMYWEERYRTVRQPRLGPVLTGFNVNIDRIVTVDHALLESPALHAGSLRDLRERLVRSMEQCTAAEWIIGDLLVYRDITEFFSRSGTPALGGQAGIAACHLAALGAPDVLCIAPSLGPEEARLLRQGGVTLAGPESPGGAVHTILEYSPGLVPLMEGAVPRNNRFIVSPRKSSGNTLLPDDVMSALLPKISACSHAFLSGYQYLSTDREFRQGAAQIRAMKQANHDLRVHIECVSATDPAVNAGIVRHILPAADSAGMNENELSLLLGRPAGPSPEALVRDMIGLADRTGLARIHLHTFGYYLAIQRNDCTIPEVSQDCLLFAARTAAAYAGGTGSSVTPSGLRAVNQVASVFDAGEIPGISTRGTYLILGIPALVATGITKTVGLGDVISSTAFAAEPFRHV